MQAESQAGDADSGDVKSYKSLARIVAEHKDIMKLSYQLSSVIASLRSEVNDVISSFSNNYEELWKSVSSSTRADYYYWSQLCQVLIIHALLIKEVPVYRRQFAHRHCL